MSDMNGAPDARWQVDIRDVMAGAGAVLVIAGAWIIHPGLVVVAAGCGLAGGAWYLAKRKPAGKG